LILTIMEVTVDLKVANETVYRLIHSGKLKAFKIGNRYRVTEEELKRYKEEATNETMS
jgi:excisionase family DNA binding protein